MAEREKICQQIVSFLKAYNLPILALVGITLLFILNSVLSLILLKLFGFILFMSGTLKILQRKETDTALMRLKEKWNNQLWVVIGIVFFFFPNPEITNKLMSNFDTVTLFTFGSFSLLIASILYGKKNTETKVPLVLSAWSTLIIFVAGFLVTINILFAPQNADVTNNFAGLARTFINYFNVSFIYLWALNLVTAAMEFNYIIENELEQFSKKSIKPK